MYATFVRCLLLTALVLPACSLVIDGGDENGRYYGPPVAMGDGTARTYVDLGPDGQPLAVGVALSADALQGLPAQHHGDGHGVSLLGFPAAARRDGFVFDHVALGWNPRGHEPDGLFTYPHFDFHFNLVPADEIMTWTPADSLFDEKGARAPEAKYIPDGYILPPGPAVPMMGNHLVDTNDPTYAPGGPAFTEVLIWGSYDGDVVFIEPMVTKAFLESQTPVVETMAQPQAFARAGLYPTVYRVHYDAARDEYRVELGGFVHRNAG